MEGAGLRAVRALVDLREVRGEDDVRERRAMVEVAGADEGHAVAHRHGRDFRRVKMTGGGAVSGHRERTAAAAEAEVAFEARAAGEGRPAEVGERVGQEGRDGSKRRAILEGAGLTTVRPLAEGREGRGEDDVCKRRAGSEGGGADGRQRVGKRNGGDGRAAVEGASTNGGEDVCSVVRGG